MYQKIEIAKLSDNQLKNLLKGKSVRIKKGSSHSIHLSPQQIKHLESASKKGKCLTIQFDPYQMEQHGSGLMGNIANFVKKHKLQNIVNPVISGVKRGLHSGLRKTHGYLHNKIDNIKEVEGDGLISDILGGLSQGSKMLGYGCKNQKKVAGDGIVSDVLSGLSTGSKLLGFGVAKKHQIHNLPIVPITKTARKGRKGKGLLSDLVKTVATSDTAKNLVKGALNTAVDYGVKKIAGNGVKRGRKSKTIVGSALMPAGY